MLQLLAGETRIAVGDTERACEHLRASLATMEGLDVPLARQLGEVARRHLARYGPASGG
jgi:hypothetical protein